MGLRTVTSADSVDEEATHPTLSSIDSHPEPVTGSGIGYRITQLHSAQSQMQQGDLNARNIFRVYIASTWRRNSVQVFTHETPQISIMSRRIRRT